MSDPRSTYPQAQAWTFLLDTPSSGTSGSEASTGTHKATAAEAAPASVGGARPRLVAAGAKDWIRRNSGSSGTEEMGAMCSKPNDTITNVANKENMGEEPTTEVFDTNGGSGGGVPTAKASSGGRVDAECSSKDAGSEAQHTSGEEASGGEVASGLDSTAFLSPDPGPGAAAELTGEENVFDVGNGINKEEFGGYDTAALNGDGQTHYEDRSAWVARNLAMLPGGGGAVELDHLAQLPGLEGCLHELLSERTRHLTAMDNLTSQLRRREAEATKASHDLKALSARLESAEQDSAALERRARAAGEEQRVERARWFVHKQELETRCVQLESRDTQYRAAIRKKEIEYGRLQDSLRKAVDKSSTIVARGAAGKGVPRGRGIESNVELSPGESPTEGDRKPLGGVLNQHAIRRADELENENASLRSMLVDLQGEVMDLKDYFDRHGDLVSAGRVPTEEGGIWGGRMSVEPLPDEVIEGMPGDWLERQLGEETARQIKGMRGALKRVLGDGEGGAGNAESEEDLASLVAQLREARSLLREQDAIILAAIFDRPGADAADSKRCVCTCGADGDGFGASGAWESLERLEQLREEVERERSKLEKDKAKFLEEAVRRDSRSFVFSCSSDTPTPTPAPESAAHRDARYATPTHPNRQHLGSAESLGNLATFTTSPSPGRSGRGGGSAGMPLMTFTPPTASPDTAKLLGQLGINL